MKINEKKLGGGEQGLKNKSLALKNLHSQITWCLWSMVLMLAGKPGGGGPEWDGGVFWAHKSHLLFILPFSVSAGPGQSPCSLPEFQLHADSAACLSKSALLPQGFQCGKNQHLQSLSSSKFRRPSSSTPFYRKSKPRVYENSNHCTIFIIQSSRAWFSIFILSVNGAPWDNLLTWNRLWKQNKTPQKTKQPIYLYLHNSNKVHVHTHTQTYIIWHICIYTYI